jgi:hypothetical protein
MQYYFLNGVFFGWIPGKLNCSKGSKSKEYKRKKCLDFWVASSIESQGLTCRSGHYELYNPRKNNPEKNPTQNRLGHVVE